MSSANKHLCILYACICILMCMYVVDRQIDNLKPDLFKITEVVWYDQLTVLTNWSNELFTEGNLLSFIPFYYFDDLAKCLFVKKFILKIIGDQSQTRLIAKYNVYRLYLTMVTSSIVGTVKVYKQYIINCLNTLTLGCISSLLFAVQCCSFQFNNRYYAPVRVACEV